MKSERKRDQDNNEGPVHKVCVDSFQMGKYEVTQGQWQKITGENPASFKKGDMYPVEKVSWNDAQEFINKLNAKSGKSYRLPTEAEWEYACRANDSGKYCGGDNLDSLAWYDKNSGYSTHPVGGKQANKFGLYDMSGNVWEWCADWSGDNYYNSSPQDNPTGPSSGSDYVIRGGSWQHIPTVMRAANRGGAGPDNRNEDLGFRLVLPIQ
ncbi:MAG: formylglycine-generating enzyme family protein [Candidatus Electrothrix sp. AR4]|nr:formylglycine-generating enzyme family protein [Candidatus Electrothrix sp. AR4]